MSIIYTRLFFDICDSDEESLVGLVSRDRARLGWRQPYHRNDDSPPAVVLDFVSHLLLLDAGGTIPLTSPLFQGFDRRGGVTVLLRKPQRCAEIIAELRDLGVQADTLLLVGREYSRLILEEVERITQLL